MKKQLKLKRRWNRIAVIAIALAVLFLSIASVSVLCAVWYEPGTKEFNNAGTVFAMSLFIGFIFVICAVFSINTYSIICEKIEKLQNARSKRYKNEMSDLNSDFDECSVLAENIYFANLYSFFLKEE